MVSSEAFKLCSLFNTANSSETLPAFINSPTAIFFTSFQVDQSFFLSSTVCYTYQSIIQSDPISSFVFSVEGFIYKSNKSMFGMLGFSNANNPKITPERPVIKPTSRNSSSKQLSLIVRLSKYAFQSSSKNAYDFIL